MHILIVDDEPLVRAMAKRSLRDHECDMASNGDEALELQAENHFDLVITDLRMPGMNGHELACALLEQTNAPQVIVISGCHNERLTQDLLARGVQAVFQKPLEFSTFEQAVNNAVETPFLDQQSECNAN